MPYSSSTSPALRSRLATAHTSTMGPPSGGASSSWKRTTRAIENEDRKSTRLNSSHSQISYAVFCLKKKNDEMNLQPIPRNKDLILSFNERGGHELFNSHHGDSE